MRRWSYARVHDDHAVLVVHALQFGSSLRPFPPVLQLNINALLRSGTLWKSEEFRGGQPMGGGGGQECVYKVKKRI